MPTLIFEDRFNTGGTWDGSAGTPTLVSSPAPPGGGNALQTNAVGEYVFWNIPDSGFTRVVFGVWVQVPAYIASSATRLFKVDAGPSEGWCYMNSSAGRLKIQSDGTPNIGEVIGTQDMPLNTWCWLEFMYDVSSDPWEIRFKGLGEILSNTGAASASNLNSGNCLLGNTVTGEGITIYFAHPKAGVATNDNDWWGEPVELGSDLLVARTGMGMGR